jgi:hypothetical protein
MIGIKRSRSSNDNDEQETAKMYPGSIPRMNSSDSTAYQFIYEKLQLNHLCPSNDMCVETFLRRLLEVRGYEFCKRSALTSSLNRAPRQVERTSYCKELLKAVATNDVPELNRRVEQKEQILACNRYGESTLHFAARHSHHEAAQLIFKNEENPILIDDYGRSPLVDAMWAISPSFVIIEKLLDYSTELLQLTDVRGFTALNYVRKEHIFKFCLFFYSRREKYWPLQNNDR